MIHVKMDALGHSQKNWEPHHMSVIKDQLTLSIHNLKRLQCIFSSPEPFAHGELL